MSIIYIPIYRFYGREWEESTSGPKSQGGEIKFGGIEL